MATQNDHKTRQPQDKQNARKNIRQIQDHKRQEKTAARQHDTRNKARQDETPQNTTQYNTTQHNTTQLNTTQHNPAQHNTTRHSITQHNTTQHNTTQHNTTQQNTRRRSGTRARPVKKEVSRGKTTIPAFIYSLEAPAAVYSISLPGRNPTGNDFPSTPASSPSFGTDDDDKAKTRKTTHALTIMEHQSCIKDKRRTNKSNVKDK
jgi:hypothetical protein